MKIFFSGAHRTGKTTLAERVALENDFILYYTNLSEVIKKKKENIKLIKNLEKEDFYEKIEIQEEIFNHLRGIIKNGESFSVFDRSLLDNYVYSIFFFRDFLSSKNDTVEYNIFQRHLNRIKAYFNLMDYIFIVQPGIDFVENEKSFSIESMEKLNEIFISEISKHFSKERYTIIPRNITNLEERVEFCNNIISKMKRG